MGYKKDKTAVVDKGAKIGEGTAIWHFSHIMKGAVIGKKCVIGQNVFIAGHTRIGDDVKIQNNVSVYSGVTLEEGVFCGPSMVFTNVNKPRSMYPVNKKYLETLVKRGASIGANSTIICGVTIGRSAFIGAGSVVTKDVPDFAIIYGNPARVKGWICECGSLIKGPGDKKSEECPKCKTKYGV